MSTDLLKKILGITTALTAVLLVFITWVYPEIHTAIYTVGATLVALLATLTWLNQKSLKEAFKTRSVRYGANTALTISLVIAILIVVNYLNFNHGYRKDLTKDQIHSLSDQTTKILSDLKQDLKMTVFVKIQNRDSSKSVLDNYVYKSKNKVKVEYVDPDRDPARTRAAGIKKLPTIVVQYGSKENRIEEITEEKITNALIKVLKEKNIQICFLKGHGERNLEQADAEGLSSVRAELTGQSYETKLVSLVEEDKIPDTCSVIAIVGANKAFFDKEIAAINTYLTNGGRALFALDPNLRGPDFHPELTKLLDEWHIQINQNLIIDLTSRVPNITVGMMYNKEHVIGRDFQMPTLFPMTSSLDIKPNPPATLKTWWLAKTSNRAFSKSDLKELATGQVKIDQSKDPAGPFTLMVAAEGTINKDDKTAKSARIIAMGSASMATNSYARFGANLDFFMNSLSWLANDESLISIRPKESTAKPPTLSAAESRTIQLATMGFIPGLVLLSCALVWVRRRKL